MKYAVIKLTQKAVVLNTDDRQQAMDAAKDHYYAVYEDNKLINREVKNND